MMGSAVWGLLSGYIYPRWDMPRGGRGTVWWLGRGLRRVAHILGLHVQYDYVRIVDVDHHGGTVSTMWICRHCGLLMMMQSVPMQGDQA